MSYEMSKYSQLTIQGAWVFEPTIHRDSGGLFRECFKASTIKEICGQEFNVSQANLSQSKKGTVRGIYFSLAPEGQAKWITCTSVRIWDVIVDIHPDSSTFKQWEAIELDAKSGNAVLISAGLGHSFVSSDDDSVIVYLLSSQYNPDYEFGINPLDPEININLLILIQLISAKDRDAPTLRESIRNLR